jgi:hypothetical protein
MSYVCIQARSPSPLEFRRGELISFVPTREVNPKLLLELSQGYHDTAQGNICNSVASSLVEVA